MQDEQANGGARDVYRIQQKVRIALETEFDSFPHQKIFRLRYASVVVDVDLVAKNAVKIDEYIRTESRLTSAYVQF